MAATFGNDRHCNSMKCYMMVTFSPLRTFLSEDFSGVTSWRYQSQRMNHEDLQLFLSELGVLA